MSLGRSGGLIRLGILLSVSRRDAKFLERAVEELATKHDARVIFAMLSEHEIRLVEKVPEVIE
jgi:hypothetical protein